MGQSGSACSNIRNYNITQSVGKMFSHTNHLTITFSQVLLTLMVVSSSSPDRNTMRTIEEYIYDYYNYPQMFDGPSDGDQDESSRAYDSDGEHVKHVTYLQNGAVISNVPNTVPTVINHNKLQPPHLHSLDYQDKQDDAFVLQNPLISDDNGEFSQNQVLDFDATLSGMMGALAEIQKKGDSMLGSIRRQKGVLEQLDKQVETAEKRRQEAETEAKRLEFTKNELELSVSDLKEHKNAMMAAMEEDEFQMTKIKTDLATLLDQVTIRRVELDKFEESIKTRKSELENYKQEIAKATKDLSSLKDGAVTVTAAGNTGGTSPILIIGLGVSSLFNILVGGYVLSQFTDTERMEQRVTQFVGDADTLIADSLTGFLENFQKLQDGKNAKRKYLDAQGFDQYDTFRPSEQEFYSYSDLPRQYR